MMGKIRSRIGGVEPTETHKIVHSIFPQQHLRMDKTPYISDPTIVPRVQKYLESNVDKTYVDINVMADDLQNMYKEYAKRKRSAFRAAVKKAYSIVLQSYGLEDEDNSSSDDVSDDSVAASDTYPQNNSLNKQLLGLYKQSVSAKAINESEAIDISSDDSEGTTPNYNPTEKSGNGPSTSHNKDPPTFAYDARKTHEKRNEKQPLMERGRKRKIDTINSIPPYAGANKKKKSLATLQEPSVTFKDIGGMGKILEDVCKLLMHVQHPEVYKQIGISPPRGFLLHGPPGCGKTLLANAIAGELSVPLLKVAAPELVAGVSGESEERIRELFERAACSTPCILFIDEIDAITPNRQNAQKEMERRIVAQLLSCLDDLNNNPNGDRVLVIGATNRPDSIDPALRRAGRFDREICLGIPNVEARVEILKVITANLTLAPDFDFGSLARYTPGYVGADLMSLAREAAMAAVNRMFNSLKSEALKFAADKRAQAALEQSNDTKKVEENKEKPTDSNEAEPELNVDGDPKSSEESDKNATDDTVVVIDDEPKPTGVTEHQSPPVNGQPINETVSFFEKFPAELLKENTPLQDLMVWLHECNPIPNERLATLCITMEDFGKALKCVQPSAKREGFATVPDVTWDDVGSLRDVREELQMSILAPVRHSERFKELGLTTPTGVLLCGPPGCGKTLLAKAIANEAGINFISVKGPELLNMYVGESERAVRVCFERARNSAPCVIFFDELDAICPKRSDTREGGPTMRVVNQMLTEMDGVEGRQGVFLLAASNRPDIIDPAVLRPGRLDKIVFVGLPTPADRVDILRAITKNGTQPRLASDVDLEIIGKSDECRGYTGADLAALVREAGIVALKEFMVFGEQAQSLLVNTDHFKTAVAKIRPSVPEKDQKHYEKLRKMYAAVPVQGEVEEMEYS